VIFSAVSAGLMAVGFYFFFGASIQTSISLAVIYFLVFMFNGSRAEVEELKLILDADAPGWRERNASWTSTWDWNRALKRKARAQKRFT
jgi:hypothetical protein